MFLILLGSTVWKMLPQSLLGPVRHRLGVGMRAFLVDRGETALRLAGTQNFALRFSRLSVLSHGLVGWQCLLIIGGSVPTSSSWDM